MLEVMHDTSGELTQQQVKFLAQKYYGKSSSLTKLKLKCWVYYAECVESGGRYAVSFDKFSSKVSYLDITSMVKGYLIDCSDFGGVNNAMEILNRHYLQGIRAV